MGLIGLHNAEVAHGDLKGDNILVFVKLPSRIPTAKISDFGFASTFSSEECNFFSTVLRTFNFPNLLTLATFFSGCRWHATFHGAGMYRQSSGPDVMEEETNHRYLWLWHGDLPDCGQPEPVHMMMLMMVFSKSRMPIVTLSDCCQTRKFANPTKIQTLGLANRNGKSDLSPIHQAIRRNEAELIVAINRRVSRFIKNDMNPINLDLRCMSELIEHFIFNLCGGKGSGNPRMFNFSS